jgi:hypothetical protein
MRQLMVASVLLGLLFAGCTSTRQEGSPTPQTSQPSPPTDSTSPPSTTGNAGVRPSTTRSPARAPTLRILSPRAGAEVLLPAAIHYEVIGYKTGYLRAFVGEPGTSFHVDIPFKKPAGVVYLPKDKQLSGKVDVTFWLITPNHQVLANHEAHVTVSNLLLMGSRSG